MEGGEVLGGETSKRRDVAIVKKGRIRKCGMKSITIDSCLEQQNRWGDLG